MGLEVRFQQILNEIITISHRIRSSALVHANSQNLHVSEKLRRQLEIVRISADTVLEAVTTASLTGCAIDDRFVDWLISGELRLCLSKLKEVDDMLKPLGQPRPAQPLRLTEDRLTEDRLTEAMALFDKHTDLFYFLLAPNIWNRDRLLHQPTESLQANITSTTEGIQHDVQKPRATRRGTATEYEYDGDLHPSVLDQAVITRQKKLDKVLRWLSASDCTEKHNAMLKIRQEGTCGWFPITYAYKKWRTGGDHFLWLHGKAGCGKSVLVASTIEHLKNTLQDGEVVVFFYCDFQNKRSTSPTEMMRSLLSQLIRLICDCGIDPGDLPDKILEKKSKGTLSLNDVDKLCDMVARTAICFPMEPIVVIDALDECTDIEALTSTLVMLNQMRDVRLLVTSRPLEVMMRHFTGLQKHSFEAAAEELAADIALHVERELHSHNGLRAAEMDIKNDIKAKLNAKAEGRFRWVQCQLDTLKRCGTRLELKAVLDNLPEGLETTYERILWAIDERGTEGELARRTLGWLMVTLEPLRLAQVVDGLSVDYGQQKITRETKWLRAALLNALSSLVSYDEETDLLMLSHFSVQEYLTSSMALPSFQVVAHEAHADVIKLCIRYISVFLEQKSPRGNVTLLKSFSMLSYVLSSGFNHIAHVDPGSAVVLEALQSFGSCVRHYPSQWDRLCEFREEDLRWPYPPWPSSRHDVVMYVLIAYSSPAFLQSFLSACHPLKPRLGTNPLVYAADLRKTKHAMTLLAHGADVNIPSLVADGSHKALPLEVAVDLGDGSLVGALLQRGCVVTTEVLSTAVCMPWCSARVLARLTETDEFVEWAKEIGDEKLYRGIFSSARPDAGDSKQTDEDRVTLARRLREIGQDLSPDSPFGADLIKRALHAAHTSMLEFLLPTDQPPPARFLLAAAAGDTSETVPVVRFLLKKGANIHVSNASGDTALHLAATCPWEPRSLELTRILLDAGCNPDVRNLRGAIPLTIAMRRGYFLVVERLLYVSPPSDILPIALRQRTTSQMIQFLVHKGADVHFTTFDGDSVLHLAIAGYAESACLDLVGSFIEAGCNPAICNFEGETVFHIAIDRGYTSVVEHLVSTNAPLPPDIMSFALRKHSTPEIVEVLIRGGANVNSTIPNGDSVLHLAIAEYAESLCLDLVKIFIEAGCNTATRNSKGQTAFQVAFRQGYTSVVEQFLFWNVPFPPRILPFALRNRSTLRMIETLIQKGANVNFTASNGDSVLHLAVANYSQSKCLYLTKSFIGAGCNHATCNSKGQTVFEVAIDCGYTSVVEELLSIDVPFPPDILPTALQNSLTPRLIELLVQKGADVNSITSNGDSVLHLAVAKYPASACLDLVFRFIQAGCDPITKNSEGQTVFQVAFQRGYTLVVEHLLSSDTPVPSDILPIALYNRSTPDVVKSLIRRGADVDSTTFNGDSVLHIAIAEYLESSCLDLVKIFIETGCNTTARNSKGQTVFQFAFQRGYTSVLEHLLSSNVPFPPHVLPFALRNQSTLQMVEMLVHKGANVNITASNGDSVLHLAVACYSQSRCLYLVKNFIEAGCDPTTYNFGGETIFHVAVNRDYTSVVEYLFSVNVSPPPDIIPFALQKRSAPQMIELLVCNGADVNSATSNGDSVLHLAIVEYFEPICLDLVKRFIEAGCSPTARNLDAETPLDSAMKRGYMAVTQYLLSRTVPLSPTFNILSRALQKRCIPEVIGLLARNTTDDLVTMSESNWGTLLQLAHSSYIGLDRSRVIKCLNDGRKATRAYPYPRRGAHRR